MPILPGLRRFLVQLRDAIDGRLHPRRRRRAMASLRDIQPAGLLFVCLGNVCRSPYAERVAGLRARERGLRSDIDIRSAGFIGPGRPPPDDAIRAALGRNVDHTDHRSRVLTSDMLSAADATFVFDRFNVSRLRRLPGLRLDRVFWLGDFDPVWTGKRAIIDPWGKPNEEFERTFERIDRCVEHLVEAIVRERDSETS